MQGKYLREIRGLRSGCEVQGQGDFVADIGYKGDAGDVDAIIRAIDIGDGRSDQLIVIVDLGCHIKGDLLGGIPNG